MLCDELWMMCVKIRQEDLLLEVARHALRQRAQAQIPRQHAPWWRTLSKGLRGYSMRLWARWRPRRIPQSDALAALWSTAHQRNPTS
jgi:hypothetical protein